MTEQNRKLSIVAYYFSKFDVQAVTALGYESITSAMKDISARVGSGNSYLKLRRDEFDVLTGSHRRGYANRPPSRRVLEMHDGLQSLSFDDFTELVQNILQTKDPETGFDSKIGTPENLNCYEISRGLSDLEIEAIINAKDDTSKFLIQTATQKKRIYNRGIVASLKKLYQYRCQICGCSTFEFGVSIVEAHHILTFADSQNNDSDNIIILCPNHHRLIHQSASVFDRKLLSFIFSNGQKLPITLNYHL